MKSLTFYLGLVWLWKDVIFEGISGPFGGDILSYGFYHNFSPRWLPFVRLPLGLHDRSSKIRRLALVTIISSQDNNCLIAWAFRALTEVYFWVIEVVLFFLCLSTTPCCVHKLIGRGRQSYTSPNLVQLEICIFKNILNIPASVGDFFQIKHSFFEASQKSEDWTITSLA